MPENKIVISCVGDFGNPTGTGLSRITLEDVKNSTDLTAPLAKTAATTFFTALTAGEFTGTVQGDVSLVSKTPGYVEKPENSVNVDRVLVVDFRLKNDTSVRRLSIPGIVPGAACLEMVDNGERLTHNGKGLLETALTALYGLSGDSAIVVLRGKVLQKS